MTAPLDARTITGPRGHSMQFRILGSLEAVADGVSVDLGPPKQRSLLAILLMHVGALQVRTAIERGWLLRDGRSDQEPHADRGVDGDQPEVAGELDAHPAIVRERSIATLLEGAGLLG